MKMELNKTAAQSVARAEILTHVRALNRDHYTMRRAGIEVTHVILPSRLNVPLEEEDPTSTPARVIGLPIVWADGELWGVASLHQLD